MDLAAGARRLIVTMEHTTTDGKPKIVPACSLPLTAINAVDVIITELAIFRFVDGKLTLSALMPGATLAEVQEKTSATFSIDL